MDLIAFKKKYKVKKISELHKFNSEISQLIQEGFSQKSICEFLRSNGIKASQQNLSRFIKATNKIKEDKPAKQQPIKSTPSKENEPKLSDYKFEKKGKDLEIQATPDWAV